MAIESDTEVANYTDQSDSPVDKHQTPNDDITPLLTSWKPTPLDEPASLIFMDILVTIDAHLELWTRAIRSKTTGWKNKADKLMEDVKVADRIKDVGGRIKLPRVNSNSFRASSGDLQKLEAKYLATRLKAVEGFQRLSKKWEEEKTVRLRDKISFFVGVQNLVLTTLLLNFKPELLHVWYSLQMMFYMPLRFLSYKKLLYHYFLFDLCYAVNLICLIYLWILPSNVYLLQACYGLSMGSLGTAIATWRNSLVFHSLDKVISLAIHIFPPLVFTTIRHFYPQEQAIERFPALEKLQTMGWNSIGVSMFAYACWQLLYYRYVIVARREKIAQGRTTSFTYLINDKKRMIGKIAAKVPGPYKEIAFMGGQAIYTFVTLLLPVFVLYDSKVWSSVYIWVLLSFSIWTGGSFYLDVFGRKFEKELINLKRQLDEQQQAMQTTDVNDPN